MPCSEKLIENYTIVQLRTFERLIRHGSNSGNRYQSATSDHHRYRFINRSLRKKAQSQNAYRHHGCSNFGEIRYILGIHGTSFFWKPQLLRQLHFPVYLLPSSCFYRSDYPNISVWLDHLLGNTCVQHSAMLPKKTTNGCNGDLLGCLGYIWNHRLLVGLCGLCINFKNIQRK